MASAILPACVQADIRPENDEKTPAKTDWFEKYWKLKDQQGETPGSPGGTTSPQAKSEPGTTGRENCPGYIVSGAWNEKPERLFCTPWPYRHVTYEIFYPDSQALGRAIYGMALFTKDLDPSVTLERFEKGAGGFRYSMEQITAWANAVLDNRQPMYTQEEQIFMDKLVQDRLMLKVNGRYVSLGVVRHVLGAAPKVKRSLALNLTHERTHVIWEEDPQFRNTWIKKWQALTPEEKQAVYKDLKGYNQEKESEIIKEWAVRLNEETPLWN